MQKHIKIKIKRTAFYRSSQLLFFPTNHPSYSKSENLNAIATIKRFVMRFGSFMGLLGREKKMEKREKKRKGVQSLKAKHCEFNDHGFDSISERNFYVRLCSLFGTENVSTQKKLVLLESFNKSIPSITWNVDFCVEVGNEKVYVEYKGDLSVTSHGAREFFLKWKVLKNEHTYFYRVLCFVEGSKIPRWQTGYGMISVPDIHALKLYSDEELKLLIESQVYG